MKSFEEVKEPEVRELYRTWGKELRIEIIAGQKGLGRKITSAKTRKPRTGTISSQQKPAKGTIQILGRSELSHISALSAKGKQKYADDILTPETPCLILSKGLTPEEAFKNACQKTGTPLFITEHYTGKLISLLEGILKERLTPFVTAHGVLLDVYGIGVLILGRSGIGKSECALDLINRGSKLISDDIVEIKKSVSSKLFGNGPRQIKHLMEIRGVGIINIKDLFGTSSVIERREIDMVIELVQWSPDTDYERLGLDVKTYPILGVELPYLQIPVSPGRNIATIIEVAARNQSLKHSGVHSAENFQTRHNDILSKAKN
jgi:HPr kinase/phosphorylase